MAPDRGSFAPNSTMSDSEGIDALSHFSMEYHEDSAVAPSPLLSRHPLVFAPICPMRPPGVRCNPPWRDQQWPQSSGNLAMDNVCKELVPTLWPDRVRSACLAMAQVLVVQHLCGRHAWKEV